MIDLFGRKRREKERQEQIKMLAAAITEAVMALESGKKYLLIIPDSMDVPSVSELINQELELERDDIRFVIVFAKWAKMLELS
jgi:hypothetical protein